MGKSRRTCLQQLANSSSLDSTSHLFVLDDARVEQGMAVWSKLLCVLLRADLVCDERLLKYQQFTVADGKERRAP